MVVAETELLGRCDHAVGDVPIGLSGSDLKATRQHRPWQRYNYLVANLKVSGAADYASDILRLWTDLNLAPPNGLAI